MTLQSGRIYLAPDGKRYRALLENDAVDHAWTLVPVDLEQIDDCSWRDTLEQLLFLAQDKIVTCRFAPNGPAVEDTGWKTSDFTHE